MQNRSDRDKYHECFQQLQLSGLLEPKMKVKLKYLEAVIYNLSDGLQYFNQLSTIEQQSLPQMENQSLYTLFCNIVCCIAKDQAVSYFIGQKATLRKEEYFAGWKSCYLNCDSYRLSIFKKKERQLVWFQFIIQKLSISKVVKHHKDKYIFGLAYDGLKYQIGFEDKTTCDRIHKIILDVIYRKKEICSSKLTQSINMIIEDKSQASHYPEPEIQRQQDIKQIAEYTGSNLEQEQSEYLRKMQVKVSSIQFTNQQNYMLLKNIGNGRILHNPKINTLKICMLIQKCRAQDMIEMFMLFQSWNSQFESFDIINRLRNNTYLAKIRLKKYSLISYAREAYITITHLKACPCLINEQDASSFEKNQNKIIQHNKHYLLIKNAMDSPYAISSDSIGMDFDQMIEFSQFGNDLTVFMVLLSRIDFKGYEYFSTNLQMNLHAMEDISCFPKFCEEKLFIGIPNRLFYSNCCICSQMRSRKFSATSSISDFGINQGQLKRQQKEQIIDIKQKHQFPNQEDIQDIKQQKDLSDLSICLIIQDSHRRIDNQKLIQVIKTKRYQTYFIRHRFPQYSNNLIHKQSNYTEGQIRDFLLRNGRWKIVKQNLIFCNEQILKAQKNVIKMMIKKMGSNLFSGKSIMNTSLPVQIFDKYSMLEVLANMMGFFPRFISDAVEATNLVEQMKFVAMSYLFTSACYLNVQKPFNPILGQTLQGMLGGISIYLQQISHHPAISSLYMRNADMQTYGNFDISVSLGFNSAHTEVTSLFTVKIFKTSTEYIIRLPDLQLGGIMFGERDIKLVGKGFVYQKTNDLYCEYSIGKQKKKVYQYGSKIKSTDIAGGIFKVTNAFGKKLINYDKSKTFQGVKFDDVIDKYCQISGKWYGDIFFDNVPYKTVDNGPFPLRVERPTYLLPSDSLFRQDIVYKNCDMLDKSNEQKQHLQNLQRKDKKLREQYQIK